MTRTLSRGVFVVLVLAAAGFYGWSGWREYREQSTPVAAETFKKPDIPYAPTPQIVVERMLEAAKLERGDVLYDLGSGDGRIVIKAALSFGVRADGFELDPKLVEQSRAAAREAGLENKVTFLRRDILTLDLQDADVITLSLSRDLNRKLLPQLERLKPGARIVSHDWGLGDYVPEKLIRFAPEVEGGREHLIYVYTTPLKTASAATAVDRPDTAGINFVPTPEPVAEEMLVMARVMPHETVYDLGSGDGRILIAAARKYGAKAVGYEINPRLVEESRERIKALGLGKKIEVREGNLFEADLSQADVVTLYLSPTMNAKLLPQFDRMKPGSRIVSHDFDIPGIRHQTVVKVTPGGAYKRERTIYLWTTPLERVKN
ncbi:class I SAM-dependent methyltransferase [Emcibacter sp. SYSU 3D8]|uniref:SAM-dependent methyltransferase n=1 Tax=Emcibacter sp. SYSU 3D8 TaxID=3133969 RepID=UPI0031FEE6D9